MSGEARPARRLAALRRRAAFVLWAEQLVPALAPALSLALLWLGLALAGALAPLPGLARPLLAAAIGLGSLGLAILGLRRVTPPTPAGTDHRLEQRDLLRPLTALNDKPATHGADAVWRAHQARALARVVTLRPGPPRLAAHSTLPLGAALLLVLLGLAMALPHPRARLLAALRPAPAAPALPVSVEAWVVPPAALGLPPIFLTQAAGKTPLLVPRLSRLTLAVHGGTAPPWFTLGRHKQRLARLDRSDFQADLTLTRSGTLRLGRGTDTLAVWPLQVVPPSAPTVTLATTHPTTRGPHLLLGWKATDRFALNAVRLEIRRQDRPGLPSLIVPLPLSGHATSASGQLLPDLTANPWAGLPVTLRILATNTAGLTGQSRQVSTTLPERHFRNLIARVLAAERKALVLDPTATATAQANLDRLSEAAAGQIGLGAWLDMRVIAAMLGGPRVDVPSVEAQLWTLALAIEDDGVRAAREALNAARARLNDALSATENRQQALQNSGKDLQQALQKYLDALARQADQNDQTMPRQPSGKTIDPAQLQQMAKQAAEAARAGRLDEARRKLAELGNILDRLRPGTAKPEAGQQSRQSEQDAQIAQALHAIRQGEQALHSRAADRLATPQANPARDRAADAKAQAALRHQLGDLAEKLGAKTGAVPNGLATADQAMKDAKAALTAGQDKSAEAAERRALQGLQNGAQQLAQQQQGQGQGQNQGQGKGQGQGKTAARTPGQGQGQAQASQGQNHGRDPLGRAWQEGGGALDLGNTTNATEATIARGRALLQEIRRRAADRARPPAELKYLDRLLGN